MKKDISHPSVIDKVSAAKFDQTTRLIFDEFHANGQLEFLLSVISWYNMLVGLVVHLFK